jgi:hypothetical protein
VSEQSGIPNKKNRKKNQDFILPPPLIRYGGVHRVRSEPGYCDLFLQVEHAAGDHYWWSIPVATMALEKKL